MNSGIRYFSSPLTDVQEVDFPVEREAISSKKLDSETEKLRRFLDGVFRYYLYSGRGIRTPDQWIMIPLRYRCAIPPDVMTDFIKKARHAF